MHVTDFTMPVTFKLQDRRQFKIFSSSKSGTTTVRQYLVKSLLRPRTPILRSAKIDEAVNSIVCIYLRVLWVLPKSHQKMVCPLSD